MTDLLLERVEESALVGRPVVGLADEYGREVDAEWYSRQPYGTRMEWQVESPQPWAGDNGARWTVGYLLVFDGTGREVRRQTLNSPLHLSGAMKPTLTTEHIEYRLARGIPLTDDPHKGDALVVNLR